MNNSKQQQYFAEDDPNIIAKKWSINLSPGRISPVTVKIFETYLNSLFNEKARVLILGVTPELRKLCLAKGWSVVCVEKNENMILAMQKFVDSGNNDEIIVRSDWIDVPLDEQSFDLIIADAAFNMLPCVKLENLFTKLQSLLKPEGFLFVQTYILWGGQHTDCIEEIIEEYDHKRKIDANDLRWDLMMSMRQDDSGRLSYSNYSDFARAHESLFRKWYTEGKLTKKGLGGLLVYADSRKEAFVFKEKDFNNHFHKYFNIEKKFPGLQKHSWFYMAKSKVWKKDVSSVKF